MNGSRSTGASHRGALEIDFRSPWPWIGITVAVFAIVLGSVWRAVSTGDTAAAPEVASEARTVTGAASTAVTQPGVGGLGYSAPPKGTAWPAAEPLEAPIPTGPPTGNPNVPPTVAPTGLPPAASYGSGG